MKTQDTLKINDIQEKLSSCIDGELDKEELELLIDKLLENSSQAEILRKEWHNIHVISENLFIDKSIKPDFTLNQSNEFPLIDVSAEIARKIENEEGVFPLLTEQKLTEQKITEQKLIKPEITSVANSFGFIKTLVAGSAIAASLSLLVINVFNTETGQLNETSPVTMAQGIKSNQISTIASSQAVEKKKTALNKSANMTKNKPSLLTNNTVATGKLYRIKQKDININYSNNPMDNRKYSNLIHKVSLKQNHNNKKL